MTCRNWWWMSVAAALLAAVTAGCPKSEPPGPSPSGQDGEPGVSGGGPGGEVQPGGIAQAPPEPEEPEEPPPPPTIPEVNLTEELRETCRVGVGDPMPAGELVDLSGGPQPVAELFGEKLTVVFLWTVGEDQFATIAAGNNLGDLEADVAGPYAEKGVAVVAVNVQNDAPAVDKCVADAEASFPCLRDPEGAYFATVATEKLPRVYLLDAEGSILWFDVEFSATTRRQLLQGIRVALGEIGEGAPAGEEPADAEAG